MSGAVVRKALQLLRTEALLLLAVFWVWPACLAFQVTFTNHFAHTQVPLHCSKEEEGGSNFASFKVQRAITELRQPKNRGLQLRCVEDLPCACLRATTDEFIFVSDPANARCHPMPPVCPSVPVKSVSVCWYCASAMCNGCQRFAIDLNLPLAGGDTVADESLLTTRLFIRLSVCENSNVLH